MAIQRTLCHILLFTALSVAVPAQAGGWYQVRNYVGTIGQASVHVSLQTFDWLNQGEPRQWHVGGSYYYDSHRIPIALQGKRQPDGSMQLCEASAPRSFGDSLAVPATSPTHPAPCPITLQVDAAGANGQWQDNTRILPIKLRQIGRLDDTGARVELDGVIEIPMWHHTKTHLLLGVYRTSVDCPLSMAALRLVNTRSGKVDRTMTSTVARGP